MFKKILVPLDSSQLAEQALPIAFQLARKMQAEIILLSVAWRKPYPLVEPMGYGLWLPEDPEVNIWDQIDRYLKHTQKKHSATNLPIRRLLLEGDEAGMIVDTAVSEQVDLIVMTTHGRSGISRWLMGSVTEKVMRQSPCPILVLRDSTMPDNIIITLDGSELAEAALLPGLAISLAAQAEVTLLQVNEREKPDADQYLQTVVDRFGHHAMKTAVPAGRPAEGILDYAQNLPNTMIVISTHGRTGLARWAFGSVAEKVVRGALGPVMVVRPPAAQLQ